MIPPGAFKKQPPLPGYGQSTRQGAYRSPGKNPLTANVGRSPKSPRLVQGNNGLRGSGAKFYK